MRLLVFTLKDGWLRPLARGFRSLGVEVLELEVQGRSFLELREAIERFEPDFCFSHNLYIFDRSHHSFADDLMEYFGATRRKLLSWYLDHPYASGHLDFRFRWFDQGAFRLVRFFSCDRGFLPIFRKQGAEAHHLPLAVDGELPSVRIPDVLEPPCFVASPYAFQTEAPLHTTAALTEALVAETVSELLDFVKARFGEATAKALQEPAKRLPDAYRKFFGHDDQSPDHYGQARSELFSRLFELIPRRVLEPVPLYEVRVDWVYSFHQMTRWVCSLMTEDLQVYGGDRWAQFLPNLHHTPRYLSSTELMDTFRRSLISFNYTKRTFISSVVERPLLALAAGGFPLTDEREEIYEMFGEDTIATYRCLEEAREQMCRFAKDLTTRGNMIARARTRLFQEHTFRHRAAQVLKILQAS